MMICTQAAECYAPSEHAGAQEGGEALSVGHQYSAVVGDNGRERSSCGPR